MQKDEHTVCHFCSIQEGEQTPVSWDNILTIYNIAHCFLRRLSELEKETDALRKRLRTEDPQASVVIESVADEINDNITPDVTEPATSQDTQSMFKARGLYSGPGSMSTQPVDESQEDQSPTPTVPQTLDGVFVSSIDIDNIFEQ